MVLVNKKTFLVCFIFCIFYSNSLFAIDKHILKEQGDDSSFYDLSRDAGQKYIFNYRQLNVIEETGGHLEVCDQENRNMLRAISDTEYEICDGSSWTPFKMDTCIPATNGVLRYRSGYIWECDGSNWVHANLMECNAKSTNVIRFEGGSLQQCNGNTWNSIDAVVWDD
jgi:hypothetical protein